MSALLVACLLMFSQADKSPPQRSEITDFIPYGREPIDYFNTTTDDPISRLQMKLRSGELVLKGAASQGYLPEILDALQISPDSQLLVYSKTARHPELISPKSPRALYFNDEVSVGWVPGATELEFTATDPLKGINFYTLPQPSLASKGTPLSTFQRKDQCLACHAGRSTLELPGFLLRAFQTDASGKPVMGYSVMNQDSSYERRWGGWFVVGTPPKFDHRGNLLSVAENDRDRTEPGFKASRADLKDVDGIQRYLRPNSDVIAHLVLAHQTQCLNLVSRVAAEARFNRRSDAEEKLIRCLVFADEPLLPQPLDVGFVQSSVYRRQFEAREPLDDLGRSLRQFDLKSRVFRYRLSFLVRHPLMRGLPNECRQRLWQRLRDGFSAAQPSDEFQHLSPGERAVLLQLLPSI